MVAAAATLENEKEEEDQDDVSSKKQRSRRKQKRRRGLALATKGTAQRVGRVGGLSPHKLRGLQAASESTRKRVSTIGGKIRASDVVSMTKARERAKETLRLHSRHQSYTAKISKDSKILEEHYSIDEVYASGSEEDDDGNDSNSNKKEQEK